MAKMIPAQIDPSVPSSAEKRVFNLLAKDPGTEGWMVFHSLGLAHRDGAPYGEIDFVVIVPGEGIVTLEVKGGRLSCVEGVWYSTDRFGKKHQLNKNPFMQSRDAMFGLRDAMIGNFGNGSEEAQCPVGNVVVFPDIECPPITPEIDRGDVIDRDDLRRPISVSLKRVFRNRLRRFQRRRGERIPTPKVVNSIRRYFRPNFERVIAKSVTLGRSEEVLLRMTEEQYDRLDMLMGNPRCLFEGAAGTGKTLLALEYAKRAQHSGFRVALACFNSLLAQWLQRQTEGTGITTGTWHQMVRQIILAGEDAQEFREEETQAQANNDTERLFGELYPFYAELALERLSDPFDVLVMDEGQDLCDETTLDVVNRMIDGGLAGGRWAIFGDFSRQAIYQTPGEGIDILNNYAEHFATAKLTLNCRNTRNIGEEITLMSGFAKPPFRLNQEKGLPVEYHYWESALDLENSIGSTIKRLDTNGIVVDDIVVLSPNRLENSSLASISEINGIPVVDCSRSLESPKGCLKFATIHAFKGLESPVVFVIDVDGIDDIASQSLMYVGMSRARGMLILMLNERVRPSINARIREGIQREIQS